MKERRVLKRDNLTFPHVCVEVAGVCSQLHIGSLRLVETCSLVPLEDVTPDTFGKIKVGEVLASCLD